MATLTLADYALSPQPLVAAVAKVLQQDSKIMDMLPFQDVGTLSVKVIREGGMPSLSWRKVNSTHGSSKASAPDMVEEQAFSIGNYIDVDKVYIKNRAQTIYDPRTYWTQMTVRSIGRHFTDAFINGLPTDADRPVGLFYRVMNDLPSSQRVAGGGLDISPDAANLSANIQQFLDKLDELIYACYGHTCDALICNDTMLMRIWSSFRQSGVLDVTRDNLGREFYTYKGIPIVDAGFKSDDTTKIIGNAETTNGSALTGGSATSIYAVKLGSEFLTGWQEYPLEVNDLGLLNDGVFYRTVIDWVVGIAVSNPRSVARLYGVIAA